MRPLHFIVAVLIGVGSWAAGDVAHARDALPRILVASTQDFQLEADRLYRPTDGIPADLALAISERLAETGRFELVERGAFRRVIEEQNFAVDIDEGRFNQAVDGAIGSLDRLERANLGSAATFAVVGLGAYQADALSAMANRGAAVGADFLLFGSLNEVRGSVSAPIPGSQRGIQRNVVRYRLRLRLIDVANGTIVAAESVEFSPASATANFVDWGDAAEMAQRFLVDAIYPVRVLGRSPFVISRGARDGVQVGDAVEVFRLGDEIFDSGVSLGHLRESVGSAVVSDAQPGFSVLAPDFSVAGSDELVVIFPPTSEQTVQRDGARGVRATVALGELAWATSISTTELAGMPKAVLGDYLEQRLSTQSQIMISDRRQISAALDELAFQDALGQAPSFEAIEGADYLLSGRVDSFEIVETQQFIQAVGRTVHSVTGQAIATFHLTDTRTGVVTNVLRVQIASDGVQAAEQLADMIADRAVSGLLDQLFPFEVMHVSADGVTYLNRGAGWGFSVGDRLETVSLAEDLRDSSGASFGSVESVSGTIEVTRIDANRSIARIVDGQPQQTDRVRLITGQSTVETPPERARRVEW